MIHQTANDFSTMHLRIYGPKIVSIIFQMKSHENSARVREEYKISLSIIPKSLRIHQM